jgi:hypothetical protein
LLLFAFIASTSLGASGDTGIKGAIKDELGAAIERATVIVSGTPILLSRTNRNGEFAIAVMPGGLYDVFVSALGFAPRLAIELCNGTVLRSVGFGSNPYWRPILVNPCE